MAIVIPKVGPIVGATLIGGSGKGIPVHLKYEIELLDLLWDDGDALLWDNGDIIDWDE